MVFILKAFIWRKLKTNAHRLNKESHGKRLIAYRAKENGKKLIREADGGQVRRKHSFL